MKLGQKPPVIWHESKELKNSYSSLGSQINRLLLLETLWQKTCGNKSKFWVIDGVKAGVIYVKAPAAAARQELLLNQERIVKALNRNFDRPWIKAICVL